MNRGLEAVLKKPEPVVSYPLVVGAVEPLVTDLVSTGNRFLGLILLKLTP